MRHFTRLAPRRGGWSKPPTPPPPVTAFLPSPEGNNVFYRDNTASPRMANGTEAAAMVGRLGNQANYGNAAHTFFGYAGTGYGPSQSPNFVSGATIALFKVPASQPRVAVTAPELFNGKGENLKTVFAAGVPMPIFSQLPSGYISPGNGGDKEVCVYSPETDEWWEMYKLEPTSGSSGYHCGLANYVHPVSKWNGLCEPKPSSWFVRAPYYMMTAGVLMTQDVREVLEGKPIKHAMGIELPVLYSHVAPGRSNDWGIAGAIPEKHEGAANPAWVSGGNTGKSTEIPNPDSLPEGAWFIFPPASKASEHFNPVTEPITCAVYEAIRVYGLTITDSSGAVSFQVESPISLGSPYSFCHVNPYHNGTGLEPAKFTPAFTYAQSGEWIEGGLPQIKESLTGAKSLFSKMPWGLLEVLEPFAS